MDIEKREEGKKLLEHLRKGDIQGIIILRIDRLFRKVSNLLRFIEEANKREINIHFIDLNGLSIDTKSPMGNLLITLLGAFGELEKNLISERTKNVLEYKSKILKQRTNFQAPFGYSHDEKNNVIPNEEEKKIIELAKTYREKGMNYSQIAYYFERKNILNRRGKPHWQGHQIQRMLKVA